MKKKIAIIFVLLIISFGFAVGYVLLKQDAFIRLEIEFQSSDDRNNIEIFYNNGQQYTEHLAIMKEFSGSEDFQTIVFDLNKDYNIQKLRIDFGKAETKIILKDLTFRDSNNDIEIPADSIFSLFEPNNYIDSMYVDNSGLHIVTFDYDPFISAEKISGLFAKLRSDYILKIWIFRILLVLFVILVILIIKTNYFTNIRIPSLKNKHHIIVLNLLFLLFIFTPVFVKYVGIGEALTNRENRFPTHFPDYRSLSPFEFIKAYERYFNDNFGLRDQMVTTISYLKFKYLNSSAMTKDLITVGKDKWLFSTAYIGNMFFDLFTAEQLAIARNTIEERAIWLKDKGIRYYLVVPPTKARIYPEFLPELYKNRPQYSKIDQLIEATRGMDNLIFIDLREILINNKMATNQFIYHKFDTHWNRIGAYFGYRQIIESIRNDFPVLFPDEITDYNITSVNEFEGDLLRNLAIGDLVPREEFYFDLKSGSRVVDDKPRPYLPTAMFKKATVSNDLKVVLFGDSYSMAIRPFIAESFHLSVFLWTDDFLLDAVIQEQPEIVIQERMEIYLKEFINPNSERLIQEVNQIKARNKP